MNNMWVGIGNDHCAIVYEQWYEALRLRYTIGGCGTRSDL